MFILGINAYHADSSACLLQDGCLVAAAEEERFRRIKHWSGFPSQAITYCLEEAGIGLEQVHHVAINRDPKANLLRRAFYYIKNLPGLDFIRDRITSAKNNLSLENQITASFPEHTFKGKIHNVEHHLAHIASSFLVSPFEEAIVASIDGSGDFSTTALGIGSHTTIEIKKRIYVPHSLGVFYEAMTQYLGFLTYGDEYKVMGLASYGMPTQCDNLRKFLVLRNSGMYELHSAFLAALKDFDYGAVGGVPKIGKLYSQQLEELLGKARTGTEEITQFHKDVAQSVQVVYEETFLHLLNDIRKHSPSVHLALAGGCAMNSVANGKVYEQAHFKKVYVQPAAGDAGGAIGAAIWTWHQLTQSKRHFVMDHAYWGPQFSDDYIEKIIQKNARQLSEEGCNIIRLLDPHDLCKTTAKAISEGRIVGWFQGRMEWGPRALGNRSILADPRLPNIRDILNLKIKRREIFRPFAPSILRENVNEWFETEDDVPFMTQVFQIRPEKRALIPAVTHVDGSGRLQTVHHHTNPLYFELIRSFYELSNIPILLNTSFNENEPIVCKPEEALDCFMRTKMDNLVLGSFFIKRG